MNAGFRLDEATVGSANGQRLEARRWRRAADQIIASRIEGRAGAVDIGDEAQAFGQPQRRIAVAGAGRERIRVGFA